MTGPTSLTLEEANALFFKVPTSAPKPNAPQPSRRGMSTSPDTALQVRLANSQADLHGAFAVRNEVFFSDPNMPKTHRVDSHDARAAHFVLFDAAKPDNVLGTVRLSALPSFERLIRPVPDYDQSQPLGPVKSNADLAAMFSGLFATSPPECPTGVGANLARLCVHPSIQSMGGGKALLLAAEAWLANALRDAPQVQNRSATIFLRSLANKVGLYAKYGYERDGDLFGLPGLLHVLMTKTWVVSTSGQ